LAAEAEEFRSEREIVRILTKYILPDWAERAFVGIRRSDVTTLMDTIEDQHGARQADYALGIIGAIMNFHAARTDDYVPAVVRGMRRQSIKSRARSRVLDDDEIRALWKATAGGDAFAVMLALGFISPRQISRGHLRQAQLSRGEARRAGAAGGPGRRHRAPARERRGADGEAVKG
jgi:hypothetical protein